MTLLELLVDVVAKVVWGFLLYSMLVSSETLNYRVDVSPIQHSSHVGRRGTSQDFEAPTNGYQFPPPYQYGTSMTATSLWAVLSSSSSAGTNITDTAIDTTVELTAYSPNTIVTTSSTQTVTPLSISQMRSRSISSTPKTWLESSVLGVTGISSSTTFAISVDSTYTSASPKPTISAEPSPDSPTSLGYPTTNSSLMASSASRVNRTLAQTSTIMKHMSTTTVWMSSSRVSFESSQLPMTAGISSRFNYTSVYTTRNTTITKTTVASITDTSDSSLLSGTSSLTGAPAFNNSLTSIISSTASSAYLPSTIRNITEPEAGSTGWSTTYTETTTGVESSLSLSSWILPSIRYPLTTKRKPRTETYFSSHWINSTSGSTRNSSFPGPTQILTTHFPSFSFPTTVLLTTGYTGSRTYLSVNTTQKTDHVQLSSGLSTMQSSLISPFLTPSKSTIFEPMNFGSSRIYSSIAVTEISSAHSNPTGGASNHSLQTTRTMTGRPPFRNRTTTLLNPGILSTTKPNKSSTRFHVPWIPTSTPLPASASIVWSVSRWQNTQWNLTDSVVSASSRPGKSTQKTRFANQTSSSVTLLIGTRSLPAFPTKSNSTYHWPATPPSTMSSIRHGVTSSSHRTSSIDVVTTLVQISTTIRTSTGHLRPNSMYSVRSHSSSGPSASARIDYTSVSSTSISVKNASQSSHYTLLTNTGPQGASSVTSSVWVNSTTMSRSPSTLAISTTTVSTSATSTQTTMSSITWTYQSGLVTSTLSASTVHSASVSTPMGCAHRTAKSSLVLDTSSGSRIESSPVLTTLKTSVTTDNGEGHSSIHTVHSQAPQAMPKNANFPWGGDSPIHRHQSVAALEEGMPKQSLWTGWTSKLRKRIRRFGV